MIKKITFLFSLLIISLSLQAQDKKVVSLNDALDIALNKSSKGQIIRDALEVSEQQYHAEKINFYVPDISINGQLPYYNVSESFDNLYGRTEKSLNRRTNFNFDADITMEQSLITGGELTIKGNLYNKESVYPIVRQQFINDSTFTNYIVDVTQTDKQGFFNFSFTQPLLKPSSPKNDLHNRKDDLEIARITQLEEKTTLKKEVVEAYFGVLQLQIQLDIENDQAEMAKLKKDIDSLKYLDGILSEEEWLTSSSDNLDASLEMMDKENELTNQYQEFALLLEMDPSTIVDTKIPVLPEHPGIDIQNHLLSNWEYSAPVKKANYSFSKADRQADFLAGSYGINGLLEANYSLGRGDVEIDDIRNTNNTDSWGVSVNLNIPIWDGGKKKSEVNAARLEAKRQQIELDQTKKSVQADLSNLVNKLNVSNKKLDVLNRQIKLAEDKLNIAKYRFEDGQISDLEFLESKVYYLEAQDNYLEELKTYYLTKVELEGMYI